MNQHLHLNLSLTGAGHHAGAARHPQGHPTRRFALDFWIEAALSAESAGFDSLLVGATTSASSSGFGSLEPFTLLAALAAHTQRLGLIASVSSAYHPPYHAARKLAFLDHISGGRAGWHLLEDVERAREFIGLLHELWNSWQDAAPLSDKARGVLPDVNQIRFPHHGARKHKVEGPPSAPRPPQGHPVLVRSGRFESDEELDFAATADAVFQVFESVEDARSFSSDIKARAQRLGRDARDVKIFASLPFLVAEDEGNAHQLRDELDALVGEEAWHARLLSLDSTQHPLEAHWSPERDEPTFPELFVGTPLQLADHVEEWFGSGALDGFDLQPALSEKGTHLFTTRVAPELRRRGLLRTEYANTSCTLREHLGLPRPHNGAPMPLPLAA